MTFALHGVPVSNGIAIGKAVLISREALEVSHYLIEVGKESLKRPSALVVVPILEDLAITLAFAIGAPFSSVTFPVTVRFCAASCKTPNVIHKIITINFLIVWFLILNFLEVKVN